MQFFGIYSGLRDVTEFLIPKCKIAELIGLLEEIVWDSNDNIIVNVIQ